MSKSERKISTENYKGTRDFYPDDMRFRAWMFGVMRRTVQLYGYEEYDAPLLESYDLYKAKTGEEIVGRQLYDFIDKGERHVAIRPEMTPSLARSQFDGILFLIFGDTKHQVMEDYESTGN